MVEEVLVGICDARYLNLKKIILHFLMAFIVLVLVLLMLTNSCGRQNLTSNRVLLSTVSNLINSLFQYFSSLGILKFIPSMFLAIFAF
jgi:hypothetical protein